MVEGSIVADGYWREPERSASVFQPVPGNETARRLRTGRSPLTCVRMACSFIWAGAIQGSRFVASESSSKASRRCSRTHLAYVRWPCFVRGTAEETKQRSVALVVADCDGVDEKSLRAFATAHLPVGSVPHRFVLVDALPLGPSGKLDRARLPALAEDPPTTESPGAAAEGSAFEQQVAAIWHEILGHQRFGLHDDFLISGWRLVGSRCACWRGSRTTLHHQKCLEKLPRFSDRRVSCRHSRAAAWGATVIRGSRARHAARRNRERRIKRAWQEGLTSPSARLPRRRRRRGRARVVPAGCCRATLESCAVRCPP